MTLDGTNTWVVGAPGGACVVIDPGPDDAAHLAAVLAAVRARGSRVAAVLLTHGHADHAAGAARFAGMSGAGVRATDPAHRLGAGGSRTGGIDTEGIDTEGIDTEGIDMEGIDMEGLAAGDVVELEQATLEVVATPGHTADSLSFVLRSDGEAPAVLTGDTVLGRGSTVVAHPDGRLADYLNSLRRLESLAERTGVAAILPGHGPVLALPDIAPRDVVRGYLAHRSERLEQVRAAVAAGAVTPADVVATVYADVPRSVWPAAELSVAAQLEYLRGGTDR
jgi:glyoxylase-like metal-dependent hydrolase (beta-lactamase superfamily II)